MIINVENKQGRRAVFATLLLIILAVLIGTNASFPGQMDESIRSFMADIQTNYGDAIMSAATFLGSPLMSLLYAIILAIVLLLANLRLPALWVILTAFGGVVVTQIVKVIVHRERPIGHLLSDTGSSFPSQHVAAIWVTIFIMFLLVTPNINSAVLRIVAKWLMITLALMTMLSRMYFSAHFFSDTIAGFLLAYAWVILCASLYPAIATYLKNHFWIFKDQEA
ncbi:phosphatase PAP2 family protein [Fructobacillus ficulneus]|uniref:Membrane-associated phospholipid phosphatase n=1 Tax=Fructobacillus ficulneus TaxID=157463 RepID=A0A0K8MHC6_9LACO|nr:phosphatase PAP2 family protein [Fructobacillus ficulneus]GAO99877.1 membrane-associated phospholipid phosphatase [Fructobacillus ficulneus]